MSDQETAVEAMARIITRARQSNVLTDLGIAHVLVTNPDSPVAELVKASQAMTMRIAVESMIPGGTMSRWEKGELGELRAALAPFLKEKVE